MQLGDVFAIPLPNGQTAYGQYVFRDKEWGPLIWVFDYLSEDEGDSECVLEKLAGAGVLLGPVITGLGAAIRAGLWRIVGGLPISGFRYLGFLNVFSENNRPRGSWSYWDGNEKRILGRRLPEEYKNVELLVVWDPKNLARRIATGENPYEKMIREG